MSFPPLGLPYKHNEFEGVPLTELIAPERLVELRDVHKNRRDDVYIATFLKCGTTWLQQILCLLYDYPQGEKSNINENSPWIELLSQEKIDNALSPRVFKTHLKWRWIPKGDSVKYIYCYRNPKDVVVSYYHHMQTFGPFYSFKGTFDDFVSDVFLAENAAEYGSYFDHVAEWLKEKDDKNILFLTYEDMSENIERELKRIAEFLNIELSDENIAYIVGGSKFEAMQNNEKVNYSWVDASLRNTNHNFIRKGKVGDWVNHLSETQSKDIEKLVSEKLIPLGATIRYKI